MIRTLETLLNQREQLQFNSRDLDAAFDLLAEDFLAIDLQYPVVGTHRNPYKLQTILYNIAKLLDSYGIKRSDFLDTTKTTLISKNHHYGKEDVLYTFKQNSIEDRKPVAEVVKGNMSKHRVYLPMLTKETPKTVVYEKLGDLFNYSLFLVLATIYDLKDV